jgi:hypothetical protein
MQISDQISMRKLIFGESIQKCKIVSKWPLKRPSCLGVMENLICETFSTFWRMVQAWTCQQTPKIKAPNNSIYQHVPLSFRCTSNSSVCSSRWIDYDYLNL